MFDKKYTPIEEELEFDTIEEAMMTSCPYCSTPLEWTLTVKFNIFFDAPEIHGKSESCGESFCIAPHYEDDKLLSYKVFELKESC